MDRGSAKDPRYVRHVHLDVLLIINNLPGEDAKYVAVGTNILQRSVICRGF